MKSWYDFNQLQELRSFLVERYVDNMSTKDLVAYVMDDLDDIMKNVRCRIYDILPNYWEDLAMR